MAERIRIINTSRADCGLRTQNGIEYNIKAGAFITLPKEDAEYVVAIAPKLFATNDRAGVLRLDNEDLAKDLNLVAPGDPTPADAMVIQKALNGTVNAVKKYVADITDPYHIEAVVQTAKSMDLPTSKMKVLKEAFPDKFIDD